MFFSTFVFQTAVLLSSLTTLTSACDHHHIPPPNAEDTIAANHAARNPQQAVHRKIALDNVRPFNGHRILPTQTVVIDGAFIGTDATNATHIDGHNQILLPGLIDTHCHPGTVDDLNNLASYGVTTAFLQSGAPLPLRASLTNHTGLTDLRFSSQGAPLANATSALPPAMAALGAALTSPAQVPAWLINQTGSDWIKMLDLSPDYPAIVQPVLSALVSGAHGYGKFTVVHAPAYNGAIQALRAGADQVHHSPLDRPLDAAAVEMYQRGGQANCPTLTAMQATVDANPAAGFSYAAAEESVTKLYAAGVPILAGTDSSLRQGLPFKVPFGDSMHLELELLAQAGLSNLDVLRAATVLPAAWYGLRDRGTVEVGMRADLVLVGGDPLTNISATRDIKRIWIAGVEHVANTTTTLTLEGLKAFEKPVKTG
ncbi:MAG: hypothetical protein Q9168_002868 [Polycauliona sp. 1 TL-2023]